MHIRQFITVSIFLLCGFAAAVEERPIPEKPTESAVYDDNHLMNASEIQLFDDLALELKKKTGISLACVLANDIGRTDNKSYARATAEHWDIDNNGLMIFVAQKQHWKDIIVAPQLQDVYSEKVLAKLQQHTLLPAFREYNYSQGILALAYALAEAGVKSKGIKLDIDKTRYELQQNKVSSLMILFIMFVVFFLLMAKFSGGRGNGCFWFLFGGAIRKRKKEEPETGFAGSFGNSRSGFGGGFGNSFGGGFRGKL
ncbi:YgcG family protein [uncultured Fibrobacter sp.]|uniref:TPM domain-containing protein n=1 Tax=uncultured Fibrobacter sp. TaxID=261512 RepID=UPI0026139AD3|nr:TPM domain-containing protein [uncultured Fibrobacter sp.]